MIIKNRPRKAFTLIELLVVIAIIGLIATLSVLALTNARINARDTKRFADIKQMQTALDLFFNDAGRYPSIEEFNSGKLEYYSSSGTTTYVVQMPAAPVQADGDCSNSDNLYNYSPALDGSTYTIDFCVAKKTGDLPAGKLIAFPGGITYNPVNNNEGGETCTSETDAQFCSRLGKNCGVVTGTDNCGNTKTVTNCGSCSLSQNCNNGNCTNFTCGTDSVDYNGYTYPTVAIGTQCWLKENLRTHKFKDGSDIPHVTVSGDWASMMGPAWISYANNAANATNYGELYSGYTVNSPLGVCPAGWRVPSLTDYNNLITTAGANAGVKLRSCRTPGSPLGGDCNTNINPYWNFNSTNYGTDNYGFSALPSGYGGGSYTGLNTYTYLWTSSPVSSDTNSYAYTNFSATTFSTAQTNLGIAFAVRCVKGETVAGKTLATINTVTPTNVTANVATVGGTITTDGGSTIRDKGVVWSEQDNPTIGSGQSVLKYMGNMSTSFSGQIEGLWANKTYYLRAYAVNEAGIAYGNTIVFTTPDPCNGVSLVSYEGYDYHTTAIGLQCWLRENLRTHKFKDGSNIPHVSVSGDWASMMGPAWISYANNATNANNYGELYSGYTVNSPLGVCPAGWRVPSLTDYNNLIAASGGSNASPKLKSCRMTNSPLGGDCNTSTNPYWNYNAANYGTDYYGFSALPSGYGGGSYTGLNTNLYLWTSNPVSTDVNSYASMTYGSATVTTAQTSLGIAFAVRCVKGETVAGKTLATISTVTPTNVTANVATVGGTITTDGGSTIRDKGVVWSEQDNPTIGSGQSALKYMGNMSTSFSGQIEGLWANKTYYLRAYAANEAGVAYGNTITFTTPDPCNGVSLVSYEGYDYHTTAIGLQCWLRENLRTHKFKDGSDIPHVTVSGDWSSLTTPAWISYANNATNGTNYGELYSGQTANDARGVCPAGWRVPSLTDFNNLIAASGGSNAGPKLRSCRTPGSPLGGTCDTNTHPYWNYSSINYGTDYYGFSALPAGYSGGTSTGLNNYAYFWTSSVVSSSINNYASITYGSAAVTTAQTNLSIAFTIRCVKN